MRQIINFTNQELTMRINNCATGKAAALILMTIQSIAHCSEIECGPLKIPNKHGPYDYRTATKDELNLVEHAHFAPAVEALVKPMFRDFGPDLGYTLWAFPNHHRALITLVKLTDRDKNIQPTGLPFTAECYFERALRFKPNDNIVKMIYATFLIHQKRKDDAISELNSVERIIQDNPYTHYNLANLYFEANDFEKASKHIQLAIDLGWPKAELKDKLVAQGKWVEPKAEVPLTVSVPEREASQPR